MTKKILLLLGVAIVFFYIGRNTNHNAIQTDQLNTSTHVSASQSAPASKSGSEQVSSIAHAYQQQQSDIPVQGTGQIVKQLSDDNNGSRHQRILLKLPDGQSILIAHNIDLAPRVDNIQAGDSIEFKGEYAWNAKGGVVHWTHHDPNGRHPGGWLKHQNRTYQ